MENHEIIILVNDLYNHFACKENNEIIVHNVNNKFITCVREKNMIPKQISCWAQLVKRILDKTYPL